MPAEGDEMRHSEAATRDDLSRKGLPQVAAALLDRLRAQRPRVHCITNAVAQNFTANVLLAAGCMPSMTLSAEEVAAFVAGAQALLVNLGTFDRERREATGIAVEAARQGNVPWVLDPAFIDRSTQRTVLARELVTRAPTAIRLNRVEFSALANSDASREALVAYAHKQKTVLALSGETDLIGGGERLASVANGHALMAKVTAMGCAASALVAACVGVEADPWRATVGALVIVGVAGELAGAKAQGPGSFAVAILDALHNLDGATLVARARVN
jgi:hydroxyethylthiazole kinase